MLVGVGEGEWGGGGGACYKLASHLEWVRTLKKLKQPLRKQFKRTLPSRLVPVPLHPRVLVIGFRLLP